MVCSSFPQCPSPKAEQRCVLMRVRVNFSRQLGGGLGDWGDLAEVQKAFVGKLYFEKAQ